MKDEDMPRWFLATMLVLLFIWLFVTIGLPVMIEHRKMTESRSVTEITPKEYYPPERE